MNRINQKTLGIIGVIDMIIGCTIEFLIICKVVPYSIICGGMLTSYEQAVKMAAFSILVKLFIAFVAAVSAKLIDMPRFYKHAIRILKVFTVYFCINIIMNLFGKTWFEKTVANLCTIIAVLCFVGILTKRKAKETNLTNA